MLNYEVSRELVQPLVPAGTELDSFNGAVLASMVGFRFLDTRVLGIPVPGHRNFNEVNLRFYVRREMGGETRRGVVFVRELVALPLVAGAARLTYNEPYRTVPMQHTVVSTAGELQSVEYRFGGPHDECRLAIHASGELKEIAPGSEEEFLTDRGWGYTRQRDGGTIEYRVVHSRWNVWPNAGSELDGPLAEFYDEPFASILSGAPASAFIADGSPVAVRLPERIVQP